MSAGIRRLSAPVIATVIGSVIGATAIVLGSVVAGPASAAPITSPEPTPTTSATETPTPTPTPDAPVSITAASFWDDPDVCAWRLMSNGETTNVAFPDANATYWTLPYVMDDQTSITLEGSFPFARYLSLNTYGSDFNTIDTLSDVSMVPDAGSVNPFQTVVTGPVLRGWTATVVPSPDADHDVNEISGVRTDPGATPEVGFVIIRIYAPTDASDPQGGVALPTVTVTVGPDEHTLDPCTEPFNPATATGLAGTALKIGFDAFMEEAASGAFTGTAAEATFANPATSSGLFPNGDNKYIATPLSYQPGRILVVRGKAPTFVDTNAGQSVADTAADLRYWSICQNDLATPYPVIDCAADYQTALDGDGWYTYVVATDADIPARAAADPAVTLIEWGSTDVDKVLFMRNMLPEASFYPLSVQYSQAENTDPAVSMGSYYPQATYCQSDVYEDGGVEACFRAHLAATGSDAGTEAWPVALIGGASLLGGAALLVVVRRRTTRPARTR